MLIYDAGTNLYGGNLTEGWAGFANENNTLYRYKMVLMEVRTWAGSSYVQNTSMTSYLRILHNESNTPNQLLGMLLKLRLHPTAYSVAIPAYTADANQTFSSLILYLND